MCCVDALECEVNDTSVAEASIVIIFNDQQWIPNSDYNFFPISKTFCSWNAILLFVDNWSIFREILKLILLLRNNDFRVLRLRFHWPNCLFLAKIFFLARSSPTEHSARYACLARRCAGQALGTLRMPRSQVSPKPGEKNSRFHEKCYFLQPRIEADHKMFVTGKYRIFRFVCV